MLIEAVNSIVRESKPIAARSRELTALDSPRRSTIPRPHRPTLLRDGWSYAIGSSRLEDRLAPDALVISSRTHIKGIEDLMSLADLYLNKPASRRIVRQSVIYVTKKVELIPQMKTLMNREIGSIPPA